MKVYGPYRDGSGKRNIVIVYNNQFDHKTMSYARWLMQEKLNRELTSEETVDHIDGDPLNDKIENLQILSLAENIRKSAKGITWYKFICPACKTLTRKDFRQVKGNWKKGKAGPYCSRSCAGKIHH